VVVVVVIAGRREVRWLSSALSQAETDIGKGELESLVTRRGRRAAQREAALIGGRRAAQAMRRLQRSQVRLGTALAETDRGADNRAIAQARAAVRRDREALRRATTRC
jgi:hypothetical protein